MAACIVDLLEMVDIDYREHMHPHAGGLLKAGFNAFSGRTRVVEAGERIELRFHAEPFRIALFRVDVLDFAHEPYGLARFVENGHGLDPAPEKTRGLLEETQFGRSGVPRQDLGDEPAVKGPVQSVDAVFRKRAGSAVHGGVIAEFFPEAGREVGAPGLDVVLEDDAFGKFRNDAVTLLADLEFLLGLAQGGDVHDDDVEPCAPAFVAYELRLVEQPQDLPVRLGHAVLHGIVVAVHDLAVDGFEHAFAVFRVDEVVEPVAVGFPE